MKGYLQGIMMGAGCFVLGIGVLSVVLPPEAGRPAMDAVGSDGASPGSPSLLAMTHRLDSLVELAFHTTKNEASSQLRPAILNPLQSQGPSLPGPPGVGNHRTTNGAAPAQPIDDTTPGVATPDPAVAQAIAAVLAEVGGQLPEPPAEAGAEADGGTTALAAGLADSQVAAVAVAEPPALAQVAPPRSPRAESDGHALAPIVEAVSATWSAAAGVTGIASVGPVDTVAALSAAQPLAARPPAPAGTAAPAPAPAPATAHAADAGDGRVVSGVAGTAPAGSVAAVAASPALELETGLPAPMEGAPPVAPIAVVSDRAATGIVAAAASEPVSAEPVALVPARPAAQPPSAPVAPPPRTVVALPDTPAEERVSSDDAPQPPAPPAALRRVQDEGERPAPTVRAMPGQPAGGVGRAVVRTDRLPQIGVAPGVAETGPQAAAEGVEPGAEPVDGRPRWQRHAAEVEPDGRPLIGLILFDPAEAVDSEAAILALPGPVTVALPPFAPDAPRRAGIYAEAGHEVVLTLDDVPALALASDLEVLFAAWLADFPAVIGVIDTQANDARRARSLAPVLIPILSDLGLGLIAPERGLSPLLNAARNGGVAHAGLYRTLDAGDEDLAVLGRILDRVAFEAQRLGQLTVVGRADRDATRGAIADWLSPESATGRAARVQTVPAGAVLRAP